MCLQRLLEETNGNQCYLQNQCSNITASIKIKRVSDHLYKGRKKCWQSLSSEQRSVHKKEKTSKSSFFHHTSMDNYKSFLTIYLKFKVMIYLQVCSKFMLQRSCHLDPKRFSPHVKCWERATRGGFKNVASQINTTKKPRLSKIPLKTNHKNQEQHVFDRQHENDPDNHNNDK